MYVLWSFIIRSSGFMILYQFYGLLVGFTCFLSWEPPVTRHRLYEISFTAVIISHVQICRFLVLGYSLLICSRNSYFNLCFVSSLKTCCWLRILKKIPYCGTNLFLSLNIWDIYPVYVFKFGFLGKTVHNALAYAVCFFCP